MYNLPGPRMPCLPSLSCSLNTIPFPVPAKFSFASNLVHEYLSNISHQEMWKIILLLLIPPNIQQPGGEASPGCWSYTSTCLHTKGLQLVVIAELPWEKWTQVSHPFYTVGMLLGRLFSLRRGCRAAGGEWWAVSHREMQGDTLLAICSLSTLLNILLIFQRQSFLSLNCLMSISNWLRCSGWLCWD